MSNNNSITFVQVQFIYDLENKKGIINRRNCSNMTKFQANQYIKFLLNLKTKFH